MQKYNFFDYCKNFFENQRFDSSGNKGSKSLLPAANENNRRGKWDCESFCFHYLNAEKQLLNEAVFLGESPEIQPHDYLTSGLVGIG